MPESQYSISSIISVGQMNPSFVTWNNTTALNTVAALVSNDISYNTLNVSLSQTTTITGGVVTFQGSFDGVTFFNMQGFNPGTGVVQPAIYTLVASTYAVFQFNLTAIPYFQVLLSTAITGTGTVTIGYAADSFVSSLSQTTITGTVAVTQSTTPWVTDVTQWANTTLGAPSAYGTSPGAVTVMGVNAFITNIPAVTQSGTWTVQQGTAPWSFVGTLTNNNAAPAANNVGVLPAIAETAYTTVTYTTGDMVLPVTDLHGALNHDLQAVAGTAVVTAAAGIQMVGIEGHAGGVLDSVTGAAVPANAVQVGASDGTNLQPLSINVKGTQGARGLAVQELKDSGRTYVTFVIDDVVAPTTEALQTMNINKAGTVTTATSYTVTAAKTLRVQSMVFAMRSTSGTQQVQARLRSGSPVSATSGILCTFLGAQASGSADHDAVTFADGIEIAAGQQIGITTHALNAAGNATVTVVAYEY